MSSRLRRTMLLLGTIILMMQTAFMPIGMVYAETTMDTVEHEPVELPAIENSLEELTSDPNFFFQQSYMQGTANDLMNVTISSNQEVSEIRVNLPKEARILTEHLPADISAEYDTTSMEWILQAKHARTNFILPLVFESEGNYELSVGDTTATVEISSEEGIIREESLKDSSSSDSIITSEREPSESSLNNDEEEDTKDNILEKTYTNEQASSKRSSVNVSTWAQYASAINNQAVTTINVTANISGNTTLNSINRNLTINGNGFTINSQGQQYRLTGANRQITVRNATITGTLTDNFAQFTSTNGASNTCFKFSDITFRGTNRFVGPLPSVNDIFQTVIFDGGNNYFPIGGSTLFLNISDLRLINQALVETNGRRFKNFVSGTSSARINELTLSVEKGSHLSINNSPGIAINASSINLDGHLNLNALSSTPINKGSDRTQPIKINISATAQVAIEREGSYGPIIGISSVDSEISIAQGAEFDFFNRSGGPIVNSGTSETFLNIMSERLALWDSGLQNNEQASMVFSDIQATLSGYNASVIDGTTNDRFKKIYDPSGLASYSRMSNRPVEEMRRTVIAKYLDTEGNEITDPEVITGLLGENYQTKGKQISGYQLSENPYNKSGEFSRETIEVSYIYEIANVTPLDPLYPEIEVDPENKPNLPEEQGLLSIDFVSSFNFGSQAISIHEQTYYAQSQRLLNEDGTINESEERPNYVQISDRRSESERNGWELAVTQKEQFKSKENQVLNGASISLSNQQVITAQGGIAPGLQSVPCELIPGNRRTLLKAQGDEGAGTWVYRFGNTDTAEESVSLNVPKGANPEATTYKSTLTWELSAVPGN